MAAQERLARRLVAAATRIAIAAGLVLLASHWTNAFLLDHRVEGLDADVEGNAFTWASSVATFAAALAAFLHAVALREQRRRYVLLAAIMTLFSLDDVVQLHERTALFVGEDVLGLPDYAAVRLWLAFYFPLLLVAAVLLWRTSDRAWPPAGRALRAGIALLASSIPLEAAGLLTRWLEESRGARWPDDLRTGLEEGCELSGLVLVAGALTAIVQLSIAEHAAADSPSYDPGVTVIETPGPREKPS